MVLVAGLDGNNCLCCCSCSQTTISPDAVDGAAGRAHMDGRGVDCDHCDREQGICVPTLVVKKDWEVFWYRLVTSVAGDEGQ